MRYTHGAGPVEQAILRLLADGKPRSARQIITALHLNKSSVYSALSVMRGQEFRHPALVSIHAGPPTVDVQVWTITGVGRLTIRKGSK
ncbi:ArsR family transcriptional regulator [Nocardia abscessus]|uniref:ArsR family transcriptional regulator n=1 Tax=Nocardia abscessus TaxID=120957 RepID=UPI0002E16008|nr:ArsR family transcriptional regulator [Nocardia abscessus]MCC3333564.1 ArsR family transcriptional regulator [Nocardia abscessus]